jgi:hypothetical protein
MSYEARLAKVETFVDTIRGDIDRLQAAIDQLRHDCMQAIAETRRDCMQATEQVHQEVIALREHTDRSIAELRLHTDQGFEVLRKEHSTSMRWVMSGLLANTAMMAGLFARVSGWF